MPPVHVAGLATYNFSMMMCHHLHMGCFEMVEQIGAPNFSIAQLKQAF